MKMYVSGVKPNRLGSFQDLVTTRYISEQIQLETTQTYFTAASLVVATQGTDLGKDVLKKWDDYQALTYGIVDEKRRSEVEADARMYSEYAKIDHLRPVLKYDRKTEKLSVSGLDSYLKS